MSVPLGKQKTTLTAQTFTPQTFTTQTITNAENTILTLRHGLTYMLRSNAKILSNTLVFGPYKSYRLLNLVNRHIEQTEAV